MGTIDKAQNKKLLEDLVTALCDIERAEKRGNHDCPQERERFGVLCSDMLARLDGAEVPFQNGDLVRLRKGRGASHSDPVHPLAWGNIYHVHRVYYDGEGVWFVALTETKDRPDQVRFGYHLFEKVKIVSAA